MPPRPQQGPAMLCQAWSLSLAHLVPCLSPHGNVTPRSVRASVLLPRPDTGHGAWYRLGLSDVPSDVGMKGPPPPTFFSRVLRGVDLTPPSLLSPIQEHPRP